MDAYTDLTGAGVPTRQAADLTGVARATATRAAARARRPQTPSRRNFRVRV